jgi:hypothetical protein
VLPDPLTKRTDFGEHAVLVLGLALLLATLSVAAFPCWSYSRRWGFVPTGTAAILLFFVALVAVGGKQASSAPSGTRIADAPSAAASAAAPAPKPAGYVLDSSRQPIPLRRNVETVWIDATPAEQTAFR